MTETRDPKLPLNSVLERRTWTEFQDAGLLWATNTILHWFDWSLVIVTDDEAPYGIVETYPARTKYRGFPANSNDRGVRRLTDWLAAAGSALKADIAEDEQPVETAATPPVLKRFWVSWYHRTEYSPFEVRSPWWCSGWSDNAESICAAVLAVSAFDAQQQIIDAYEVPVNDLNFRFVTEKPDDWSPFNERFPRAEWMTWPE